MKYYYLASIFLIPFFSFSQYLDSLANVIKKQLEVSIDFKDISLITEKLGDNKIQFKDLFLKVPCINPLNPKNVKRISSAYGRRYHPIDKKYKKHNGIDMAAKIGTTVHATADGVVEKIVFSDLGYGKNVTIKHAYGFKTIYAHMAIVIVLKKGQKIRLGEMIGMVGSTGKSTGNHLHYEILKNNKSVNPKPFLNY